MAKMTDGRRMLILDSAYTFKSIVERQAAATVTGRDLDGYFDHIWTCHPVSSLLEPESSAERYGAPITHELAPRHSFVEGRVGRFRWLNRLPKLNLLIAQAELLWLLLRLILRERIDIVRSEDPLYNGLLSYLLSLATRRPLMIGVWGNPGAIRAHTGAPQMPRIFRSIRAEEALEQFILRRADLVIVQNEDNRRFVLGKGIASERTEIFRLGNLLHEAHFTEPGTRGDGRADLAAIGIDTEPTLLVISRLQKLKLVGDVINVVKALGDRGLRVRALFVGEGPFKPDMQRLAGELDVADQIIFCGDRDQQWLARVIPKVSVVVSPLKGRALAEGALGAAPIAAYDIDWHSELIESGTTGELVPAHDTAALADAVQRLLDDPDRARRLGRAVRRKALEMLDPRGTAEIQMRAYEKVIGTRTRAPR